MAGIDQYTKLLLHGNGDLSDYHHVMHYNSASIGYVESPIGSGAYYFDGSSSIYTTNASTAFNFSDAFTIDFWIKTANGYTGNAVLLDKRGAAWNIGDCGVNIGNTAVGEISFNYNNGSTQKMASTNVVNDGDWHHIRICRTSGDFLYLFIDGQIENSGTVSQAFTNTEEFWIGSRDGGEYFTGYLTDINIIKGFCKSTDDFSIPTSKATYDGNSSLIFRGEGDKGTTGHSFTAYNGTEESSDNYKFASGSWYFDGTTDYISSPDHEDWNFGSGDFCVDGWFNFSNISSDRGLWQQFTDDPNRTGLNYDSDGNQLQFASKFGGSAIIVVSASWTPSLGQWYHIAVTRNESTFKIFVDGVDKTTSGGTDSDPLPNLTGNFLVGLYSAATDYYFNGYIDELRVSKGVARWTSDFTPPAVEYGLPPATGNINIYTAGTDELFDIDLTQIGGTEVSGDISLYLHNKEFYFDLTTISSGSIPIYTECGTLAFDSINLYTKSAYIPSIDPINLYAGGLAPSSGNIGIYTRGYIKESGDINIYAQGGIYSSGEMYLYTKGHVDIPLYALCGSGGVYGTANGSIGLCAYNNWASGTKETNGSMYIYCSGRSAVETNISIPIYLQGTNGFSSGSIPICVNTIPYTNITGNIGLYAFGTVSTGVMGGAYESINLYTQAYYGSTVITRQTSWITNSGSIPIYVERPTDAAINLYVKCGPFGASGDINIYSSAVYKASGEINLYTLGDNFNKSGEIPIYADAFPFGEIGLYAYGYVKNSGDVPIYAKCVSAITTGNINIYTKCIVESSGTIWMYSHGY